MTDRRISSRAMFAGIAPEFLLCEDYSLLPAPYVRVHASEALRHMDVRVSAGEMGRIHLGYRAATKCHETLSIQAGQVKSRLYPRALVQSMTQNLRLRRESITISAVSKITLRIVFIPAKDTQCWGQPGGMLARADLDKDTKRTAWGGGNENTSLVYRTPITCSYLIPIHHKVHELVSVSKEKEKKHVQMHLDLLIYLRPVNITWRVDQGVALDMQQPRRTPRLHRQEHWLIDLNVKQKRANVMILRTSEGEKIVQRSVRYVRHAYILAYRAGVPAIVRRLVTCLISNERLVR